MARAVATLVMLALLLDAFALVGPPWVFLPLLPAGGLLIYWTAHLAGMR